MLPKQRVEGSNPFSRSNQNHPIYGPAAARALVLLGFVEHLLTEQGNYRASGHMTMA